MYYFYLYMFVVNFFFEFYCKYIAVYFYKFLENFTMYIYCDVFETLRQQDLGFEIVIN